MTTQINGSVQATSNAHDAAAEAAIGDGTLSTVQDTLQRMRELVLRAANAGAGNSISLTSIASEVGALTELLNAIAECTTAGRRTLLDGSYSAAFQVGPSGGNAVILDLSHADMHANSLGGSAGGGGTDLSHLAILNLDYSEGIYSANGSKADRAALSKSIVTVSDKRSDIGAVTNQIDYTVANLGAAITEITASRENLTDADMAAEAQKFITAEIQSFMAASVVVQANSSPEAVLRLLDDSSVSTEFGRSDSRRAVRSDFGRSSSATSSSTSTDSTSTANNAAAHVTVHKSHSPSNADGGSTSGAAEREKTITGTSPGPASPTADFENRAKTRAA
ncbi:MAG: flagellin [Nakamurella sp.]